MDLLHLMRTLAHFKWITMTVLCLTIGSCVAVVLYTPRIYEVDASYVLVNPDLPTDQQLQADPAIAKENANNPYLRFANQAMMGQVLATRMSTNEVRSALIAQGADKDYIVSPSTDFGGAGQILQITGVGTTPAGARATSDLVVARLKSELRTMQKVYGASDRYLMTLLPIEAPGQPLQKVSGQLRAVIGVGAAGVILLFAAITVAQAVESLRRGRPRSNHGRGRRGRMRSRTEPELDPPAESPGDPNDYVAAHPG